MFKNADMNSVILKRGREKNLLQRHPVRQESLADVESRMREIRTSGLMRGSNGNGFAIPLLSTLLAVLLSAGLFNGISESG